MRLTLLLIPASALFLAMAPQQDDRDSFAVMKAVLDSLYHSQGDRPDLVVVADSLYWREGGVAYGGKLLVAHRSVIDPSTIADFEAKTARSALFPTAFRYARLRRHTTDEYLQLSNRGKEIELTTPSDRMPDMPFWVAFTEKYPRAWGITYLSRVGFNPPKTEALIFVRHQCGGACGSAETIFLKKIRGTWRIVERINNGSNEALGTASLRYLGPGAHFIADRKRRADSTRTAIADSIRRDHAPRLVRGKVINRQTGLPISRAQIFVHTSRFPGEEIRRVVADVRGRYVIRNPLIGGTMLEVQCPGPGHRPGATLDAPSFYVFPEMDTVVNLSAPNIEPCWQSRRVQTITSGELSSREYRESPYPSPTDVAVYASVVRDLHLGDSAVISTETRPWCRIFHQCPTIQVAHLERSGLLDSSTFENFKRVASDSVRMNPVALESLHIPLLSVGERTYLTQEARRGAFFSDAIDERGFWTGLRTNHEKATRILSFTRAGYNVAHDQAIVSYHIQLPEDEIDETILLEKKNEEWRILRRHLENETISGELVSGKCVPAAPGSRPTDEQLASIEGNFEFTLVASATDGRVTTRRVSIKRGGVRFDKFSQGGEIEFSSSLVIRDVSGDHLFGEWVDHGYGHGIPIGRDGKAIPPPAGYFCASRVEQ